MYWSIYTGLDSVTLSAPGRVLSFASRNRGRARERLAAMRATLESFDTVN